MHGEPLREVGNACLCRGIGGDLGQGAVGVHRGDVDDVAARLCHVGGEDLRDEERRRDVEVEHELDPALVEGEKVLLRFLGCRFVVRRGARIVAARAVDEEVDGAERFVHFLFGRLDALFIEAVAADGDGVFAELIGDRFRRIVVDVEKRDFGAALRKSAGKLAHEDAPRTRDGDDFIA